MTETLTYTIRKFDGGIWEAVSDAWPYLKGKGPTEHLALDHLKKQIADAQPAVIASEDSMTQQYRTPDGSIWERATPMLDHEVRFTRVFDHEGLHGPDFRPQKLDEVLASWGPLSLYGPRQEKIDALNRAASATKTVLGHMPKIVATMYDHLEANGWELTRKKNDSTP